MGGGTGNGRVRGLGSARGGTHHFLVQRATAIGNVLLVTWLVASLALLPAHDRPALVGWLAQPLVAVPMMLMVANVFWHLRLGLQVLIEDYVHAEGGKIMALLALNFYAVGAAALCLFSIARIAFAGGAA